VLDDTPYFAVDQSEVGAAGLVEKDEVGAA